MKNKLAFVIFLILLVSSGYGLYRYIEFNNNFSSSNAVFVKSDSLTFLSFKLPGKIEKIYVNEGDSVKKGSLIAKLDTKDLEIRKKELKFNILALKKALEAKIIKKDKLVVDLNNSLKSNEIELKKLIHSINAKNFEIKAKEAKLNKLREDFYRFKNLYLKNKISKEKFEKVKSAYDALSYEIQADKEILASLKENRNLLLIKKETILNSKKDIKRLQKDINATINKLNSLKERLALINQKINDSFLYAPFAGKIAKKFANNNEIVNAGMKIVSLVNPNDLYVLDLIEETKLKGIKRGCFVKIHIDALNKDYEGYVDRILPVSAATFALVPRDISSGEFTKLAQRFYLKIKFKKIPKDVLVGMSGEVIIKKCKIDIK